MNNKIIYCWCSDLGNQNGEGILARTFLEKTLSTKYSKIYIKSNYADYLYEGRKLKLLKKKNYPDIFKKYLLPFLGVFFFDC